MRPRLWERIKQWVCRRFGHRQGETWEYNGTHAVCKRCRFIYDIPNASVSTPGGEPGYAPRECSAMSADTALAIADGVEPGDPREAARVLAGNARWYKDEYERLRKAYAHDVRQNAQNEAREDRAGSTP